MRMATHWRHVVRLMGALLWSGPLLLLGVVLFRGQLRVTARDVLELMVTIGTISCAVSLVAMIIHLNRFADLGPLEKNRWRKRLLLGGPFTACWYLSCGPHTRSGHGSV